MQVALSFYELSENIWSAGEAPRPRFGTLLKMTFPWGPGFADFCPFDRSREEIVDEFLSYDGTCLQLTQSLLFSLYDSLYRSENIGMLALTKIPVSHWTVTNFDEFDHAQFEDIYQKGFRCCKIKVSEKTCKSKLLELFKLASEDFKFRLDFNGGCVEFDEWKGLFAGSCIEFIEDPTPFSPSRWQNLQVSWGLELANDKSVDRAWDGISVFKPAVNECMPKILLNPVVITSYLDHPVGQSFAAWTAGLVNEINPETLLCGLLTQDITGIGGWLEPVSGPEFEHDGLKGIGFEKNWEQLVWQPFQLSSGIHLKQLFSLIPTFIRSKIEFDLKKPLRNYL